MWTPADISQTCSLYPSVTSCQSSVLTFMAFITQYFGYSRNDKSQSFHQNEKDFGSSQTYDFIIVGAGSAGCVLANRLSEIKNWRILLIEAGGEEPKVAQVPAFANILRKSSIDWQYKTQSEPVACKAFENSVCPLPRGKVMGGSSTINGLFYIRGNKEDYNDWERLGNPGWSYDEVLKYFKKSEDNLNHDIVYNDPERHRTGGYLGVEKYRYFDKNGQIIIDGFKEIGLPEVDVNSVNQIGTARAQVTARRGVRQSTNEAFIKPIRNRPNLIVKTNAFVTKVLIDPTTKRAFGIEYSSLDQKNVVKCAYATKEVVVSAGVFNSPKLLMLSGVGPSKELRKFGIDVMQDLPVGENLHDHITVTPFIGILNSTKSTLKSVADMTHDTIKWLRTHDGPLSGTGSIGGVTAFAQTSHERRRGVPDVQYFMRTIIMEDYLSVKNNYRATSYVPTSYYDAIMVASHLLNPQSRGKVRLNPTDVIWGPPLINLNYFTHPKDLETIVEGSMIAKKLFATKAFRHEGITRHTVPLEACKHLTFDSPDYYACVALNYTRPGDHSVGTCKMGPQNDKSSVVDSELRVHGINNLRVADASIIPVIPKGNINAPVIMIGEKASDMIKEVWLR